MLQVLEPSLRILIFPAPLLLPDPQLGYRRVLPIVEVHQPLHVVVEEVAAAHEPTVVGQGQRVVGVLTRSVDLVAVGLGQVVYELVVRHVLNVLLRPVVLGVWGLHFFYFSNIYLGYTSINQLRRGPVGISLAIDSPRAVCPRRPV